MKYLLKSERGTPATELSPDEGDKILQRGRHQGRRVVEVYVRHPTGAIDRYEERARRKLGSNAIANRTWLCETYHPEVEDDWGDERYIPNPEETIAETDPAPDAVILVLLGAESDTGMNVEQLTAIESAS